MGIEKLISRAKPEIRPMLRSVYAYNSSFAKTPEEKELLFRVLEAMPVIDRAFFISREKIGKAYAYEDTALSIGKGQTISQPSTVARMLILAGLKKGDNVLEVGTGSGWNASLIAFLVYPGSVTSIERISSLLANAKSNIKTLKKHIKNNSRLSKIKLIARDIFDFSSLKSLNEKYDKILFTAGIADEETEDFIMRLAMRLLKKNGILVCPYTTGPMLIVKKTKHSRLNIEKTDEEYVFVPLIKGVE